MCWLHEAIIRDHIEGVVTAFGIRILELQADGGDPRRAFVFAVDKGKVSCYVSTPKEIAAQAR